MVEFLTPLGWIVAAAALVPVGAAIVRERRDAKVRGRVGLTPPGFGARAASVVGVSVALALLAAATARPAIRTSGAKSLRTDTQIYFVVDISRSMLARLPHRATRYDRALAAAERLRSRLADVPAGVASLTDRPLPHLFPTGNRALFSAVLHRAIGIQRPPAESGQAVYGIATSFDPLTQLATAGYFTQATRHKIAILLTDGESSVYSPETVARELRSEHIVLLVVRFWNPRERVYTSKGRVERYRPDRRSLAPLQILGTGLGRRVFDESELAKVVRTVRTRLGGGPTRPVGVPGRVELSPYLALAAVVPIVFVLRRRNS